MMQLRRDDWARWCFAGTGILAFVGVLLSGIVAWRADGGFFSPGSARFFNVLTFFTIESNLIVAATCLLLAGYPDRRSDLFRTARQTGLVGITITGIVYHWLLSEVHDPHGIEIFSNLITHYLVPIVAVAGFVAFGPFGTFTARTTKLTLVFLLAWAVFTLIRGEIVDWYPYPFIDVNDKGYGRVAVNSLGVGSFYAVVAVLYLLVDRVFSARGKPVEQLQPA